MFRQIIHPENKSELVVQLPEEFIGKEVEIIANVVSEKRNEAKMKNAISSHTKNPGRANLLLNGTYVVVHDEKFYFEASQFLMEKKSGVKNL